MTKVGLTANNLNRSVSTGFQRGMGSLFLMSQWKRINNQHASTPSAGADFWCEPWSMSASTVAERGPYTKSDYHPVQSASYVCNYMVCI